MSNVFNKKNYLLESKSRKIFHELQLKQNNNNLDIERLKLRVSPSVLRERKNFFLNKKCIDVGCGSNFNGTISLLQHGAKHVTAVDLDDSIMQLSEKVLSKYEKSRYEIKLANVLNLEFEDNSFDFTMCIDVLHHSSDVFKGLKELVRVTKPGGLIYINTYGFGGLIRELSSFLREKYRQDTEFESLINKMEASEFLKFFKFIKKSLIKNEDYFLNKIEDKFFEQLFDKSLLLTIKDLITAPVYHETSEVELRKFFKKLNCEKVTRLKFYPKFHNIRRILSPLYFDHNNKYAKLLYGDGSIKLKAIKK